MLSFLTFSGKMFLTILASIPSGKIVFLACCGHRLFQRLAIYHKSNLHYFKSRISLFQIFLIKTMNLIAAYVFNGGSLSPSDTNNQWELLQLWRWLFHHNPSPPFGGLNTRVFFHFRHHTRDHTAKQLKCCCRSLGLGAGISGSWTTFGWLQDVLFTHLQGVVILYKLSSYNRSKIAAVEWLTLKLFGSMLRH